MNWKLSFEMGRVEKLGKFSGQSLFPWFMILTLFLVWKEDVGALSSSITSPSLHLFEDATTWIQIQVRWLLLGASEPPITTKHGNLNQQGLNTSGWLKVVSRGKGEKNLIGSKIAHESESKPFSTHQLPLKRNHRCHLSNGRDSNWRRWWGMWVFFHSK